LGEFTQKVREIAIGLFPGGFMRTNVTSQRKQEDSERDLPRVIPAVELTGSRADKLRTLDESIVTLQKVRRTLAGERHAEAPPSELRGRYIDAPVWPWFTAGWLLGVLFVLLFLLAYRFA
jgi:hypothetical protein